MRTHLPALAMALLFSWLPESARADTLDLQSWLDRPGVRAVAVEFFAPWCKPCMEAMPRWKELQKRYAKDGLRVIFINADTEGECPNLGWRPDELVCDLDGAKKQLFGVSSLPSAFLWSWDRRLLVQRGHIDAVEGAVESLFASLPRVDVTPEAGVGADVVDEVKGAINYSAKMRVVASEAERAKLRELRMKQQSAHVAEETRCELGKEIAANNSLSVSRTRDGGVKLKLLSIETGCEVQSSTGATARDAVENLVGKLRVPLEWPSGGKRAVPAAASAPVAVKPAVAESKLGGGSSDFDFGGGEEIVTSFESEPAGAIVLLDNQMLCSQTPCSKPISAGSHQVLMTMEGYDSAAQQVAITPKNKRVSVKLPPNFALLTVVTTPPGLPITLDGKGIGTSPIADKRIDAKPHDVMVQDPCYADVGERIVVGKAEKRTLKLDAQPRWAGLKVSAEDEQGNALEAEIEVDGQAMGPTPKNVKVPMCAKEIVVKAAGGKTFKQALSLREKEIVTIAAKPKQGCPAGMVFIPGGTFDMGSNDGESDEKPVHRVTVSSFCIDRTEHAESNGMPTVNVDWNRAKQICESEGKRLPTEAEWEFAARGPQGRKYPWGNSEPTCDKANYEQCGGSAKRVGSLPAGATPEGVQDLAGNVWEWVADCYGEYLSSPQNNPLIWQGSCQARVGRGGGFNYSAAYVRSSNRDRSNPRGTRDFLGFRCARGTAR